MPRYGPPPSDEPPEAPSDDDKASLTKWSWRAKLLAVIAGFGMVAAFVFEFLPPTSNDSSQKISTTVAVTTTTTALSTTTSVPATTTSAPVTTTATR